GGGDPMPTGVGLVAGVGLKKVRDEQKDFNAEQGTLTSWEPMEKKMGMQGVAAIVDSKTLLKQAEDKENNLLLVKTDRSGTISYWAGFAWDHAGKITDPEAWKKYVSNFAKGLASPIEISISSE